MTTTANPVARVFGYLEKKKPSLLQLVPRTLRGQMTWESIQSGLALAFGNSPKLAQCDPLTIYRSLQFILRLGLDPSGQTQQAYLVPFKKRGGGYECTAMLGQQGKIELAYRSGRVVKIVVQVIYEHDTYEIDLANGDVSHTLDIKLEDRGEMLAAYARIWLRDSPEPLLEVMTRGDWEKIKASVKARNFGKLGPAYKDWESEMWRRSVLSRALKRAPKSADLMEVLDAERKTEDRQQRGEIIDVDWAEEDEVSTIAGQLGLAEAHTIDTTEALAKEPAKKSTRKKAAPEPDRTALATRIEVLFAEGKIPEEAVDEKMAHEQVGDLEALSVEALQHLIQIGERAEGGGS